MSDIICPMLSALWPTDDDGQPVNRECIYERCRFFDTDHKDCSLMMANRAMLTMADKGLTDSAAETERVTIQIEHRLTDLRKDLLDSQREVLDTVRDTGRPTTDPGESIESIIPKIEEAVAGRLEQRLTDLRQELLNSHREVLDTVRDAGQRSADPGDFINSTIPKIEEAIARRLEEMQSRISEASARRVEDVANALRGSLDERLTDLENRVDQRLAERLQASSSRLDDLLKTSSEVGEALTQVTEQFKGLTELQQKAAERILEELSLVSATSGKIDGALTVIDGKINHITDESLQFAQIVTLVKGETERTYAALRKINEGNQAVVQAIETQLKRDQTDLDRKRKEESLNCNNRGVVLYYRGAHQAAVDSFRKALQLQPDYAEACNNLGLALSKMGNEKEAIESFEKALKIDPNMGEVYNNLGFLYHTAAQFDRAAQMFGQAIENAADSSVAYTNLGNTFYKLEQPEKAVAAWRRAVEFDPMNENARRGLRMFQQDATSN